MLRQENEFYPRLEALRGLAALVVAANHVWQSPWSDPSGGTRSFIRSTADGLYGGWTTLVLSLFGNGLAAVNLFFVISGFVLLQSLVRGPASTAGNIFRFIIARVFRIYPAAIATVGIFLFIFYLTGATLNNYPAAYAPLSLLRNALLIDASINGVMWTLRVEVIAIPLFIAGFLLFRFRGVMALAVLLAILLMLATANSWNRLVDTPYGLQLLSFFAVGMIVYAIGRKGSAWLPMPIAMALLVLGVAGMLSVGSLRLGVRGQLYLEMICDGLIVGVLAFSNLGGLGKFFDCALIRFFGRISYSFYLVNPLTLMVCWYMPDALGRVMGMNIPGAVVALALFAMSVVATTPVAWLMYKYVERPGIAAGRFLLARFIGQRGLILAAR
jgi:peptidoglycan/LPS O-acetylase OafA/YrhL